MTVKRINAITVPETALYRLVPFAGVLAFVAFVPSFAVAETPLTHPLRRPLHVVIDLGHLFLRSPSSVSTSLIHH